MAQVNKVRIILDAEFDGLAPTKVWVVCTHDVDTGVKRTFRYDEPGFRFKVVSHLEQATTVIGHHILLFDAPHLRRLLDAPGVMPDDSLIDTLVLSRLVQAGVKGGHSVENLGRLVGAPVNKVKVAPEDWSNPDKIDLFVERCKADVTIQHYIWKDLERFTVEEDWKKSVWIEHQTQLLCGRMHENGFAFDYGKAKELLADIEKEMEELEKEIIPNAPPLVVYDKSPIKLKRKKDGEYTKHTHDTLAGRSASFPDGCEYYRFHYEPFNPGSAAQRVKFLNQCGWKPYEKTKGHIRQERVVNAIRWKLRKARNPITVDRLKEELASEQAKLEVFRETGWKVSEGNLDTLPATAPRAASLLAQWLTLEGRRGDLVEWMAAYVPDTGRIHGHFNGIGAWTHRMSHNSPNQGNIFSSFEVGDIRGDSPSPVEAVKLRYNNRARSLWWAGEGNWLTGTDAKGIQLRILADLIGDKEYSHAVCYGKQENGTDIHSVNARLLGPVCASRSNAKTFIYAFILGAGTDEVARILQAAKGVARDAVVKFVDGIPGLRRLKQNDIPRIARAGFFVGYDGRKVVVPSEHHVLAGLLQNGEQCVMKHAVPVWERELKGLGIGYKLVDFVHDEWQTESYEEEEAKEIGRVQSDAITKVGEELGFTLPLEGEYKVGRNWYETH